MLGDLQEKKAAHYFDLIDEDDNGVIEASDFEARVDRLAAAQAVTEAETREAIRARVMVWWRHLCAVADANEDGTVTWDEWRQYWEALDEAATADDQTRAETLNSLDRAARGTLRAIDTTGSGAVTEAEYADWLAAWGVAERDVAFDRLDRDGTGTLSDEDFETAVREFYLSNAPDAPGNALYGVLDAA